MVTLDRRRLIVGAAGLTMLGRGSGPVLAQSGGAPPFPPMRFTIRVDGKDAGLHTLRFVGAARGFDAFGSTRIQVKVAFITAYRFSQETEEHWEDGTWSRYRSTGAEDGQRYRVEARRTPDSVLLNGRSVRTDLMPASFWNRRVLEGRRVIDPVKGTVVPQSVQPRGRQPLMVRGTRVTATAYAVDSFLDGIVWYAADGSWLAASFDRDGHAVAYVRAG